METYPLADSLTLPECRRFAFPLSGDPTPDGYGGHSIKAVRTGAFRPPEKGDWYLSGAEPYAWRCKGKMRSSYNIARLVRVVTEMKPVESIIDDRR